jgi:hypothetical protein
MPFLLNKTSVTNLLSLALAFTKRPNVMLLNCKWQTFEWFQGADITWGDKMS